MRKSLITLFVLVSVFILTPEAKADKEHEWNVCMNKCLNSWWECQRRDSRDPLCDRERANCERACPSP